MHQTTGTIVGLIAWNMVETLFAWDNDFQLTPMLAESLDLSADKLTYTLKLRQGVPFHNGDEMKAPDVIASIQRWGGISGLGKGLLAATETMAGLTAATSTDFSTFAARGGKLMLIDGWSDPIFSANDLVRWHARMAADMEQASGKPAGEFARLFMVPGMAHCAGGQALDDMDGLGALVKWVEQGEAPAALRATGRAFPGVSRPICAWPQIARYQGAGPLSEAASFACAR